MSSTSEGGYVDSLKQIKGAEEKAQTEIEDRRKIVEEEIKNLQVYAKKSIEASKAEGEKLVETSIEQARKKAANEADKIIQDAKTKAKAISIQMNDKTMREIIGILLKGVE